MTGPCVEERVWKNHPLHACSPETSSMKPIFLSVAILLLATSVAHSDVDVTRATLREHVLKLINADREVYGLPPVALDLATSAIADAYCERQIVEGTNGHFGLDGQPPYMRYSFAGGNDGISENAAAWSATYAFSERALYEMSRRSQDAMMAETPPHDGHKRTILDPHATHVGIGLAWERGEFRLAHEFIRRYVRWDHPLPRRAHVEDTVIAAGRPIGDATIEAITVHYEREPHAMPAHVANAIESYSLPENRREYIPKLQTDYKRHPNGTLEIIRREYSDGRQGDFRIGRDGEFTFAIPFTEGPGIYTVVVWVRRPGASTPVAATNISMRIEGDARLQRAGVAAR